MIRNIIFDVGKVLVSYEPDAYMQRLGISKEKQKKLMKQCFKTNCGIRPIRDLGHRMNSYRNLLREHPNWQTKLRKSIKPSEIPWNCSRMPWNGFSI